MDLSDKVKRVVEEVVGELNADLPPERRLDVAPGTVLVGEGSNLESLDFVNLVVSLEQRIEAECGLEIGLSEDPELLDAGSPAHTLGSLSDHVAGLVDRGDHG